MVALALLAGCDAMLSPPPDGAASDGPARDGAARDGAAGDSAGPGENGIIPSRDAARADLAAFHCTLPAAAPTLAPKHWLHPAAPVAGQTVTLVLQSGNTKPPQAPKLVTELSNRRGKRSVSQYELAGGANAIFYIAVADLAEGENCLVVRAGTTVELAIKVNAAVASPLPRGGGVWKIKRHHQWTCQEQPTWGNLLKVKVLDEKGGPVNGARVALRFTDDTVYPVKPDSATSFAQSQHPKTLTTDANGEAALMTPWGEGVRSPIDSKPGYAVYLISVEGGASDVATEISTGLWETNIAGCNYCSTFAVNVYGHWSHTVEFQRDPAASKVCEVGNDHQGQQKCAFNHFFHDPGIPSCRPVAP